MKDIEENPNLFPMAKLKTGFFSSERLTLAELDKKIIELKNKLIEYEKRLSSEEHKKLFAGIAFVIFEKPEMA